MPYLRGQYGEERYEKVEFQSEIQRRFEALRGEGGQEWLLVDASQR